MAGHPRYSASYVCRRCKREAEQSVEWSGACKGAPQSSGDIRFAVKMNECTATDGSAVVSKIVGGLVAVKKSEIYSSLWASCDALRGGMDASQYKDYVLVLLFVKYVSDKYFGDPDGLIEIPEGGSFADMVALKGDKEIGEKINIIIAKLAEANDLKGVIDVADFNEEEKLGTGKEMVDRLSNLVAIFNRPELDFRKNRAEGDDILGDAYEYLMRHFATESGKRDRKSVV